jgi:hypothetical protein
MKNQNITFTAIVLALGALAFLPQILAVSPPPDGCYPGLTTAEGCSALFSLTTGQGNTAIGHDALFSDTEGSWNTGVGAVALGFNNADFNTAVGVAGLLLNDSGGNNTAMGAATLLFNDSGESNTATGAFALYSNVNGSSNTAIGTNALFAYVAGDDNTAVGFAALSNGVPGATGNTAIGSNSLLNTAANFNTAVGYHALLANTTGPGNTAIGYQALQNSTTTVGVNTALGYFAGAGVTTAHDVICLGPFIGQNVNQSCFIQYVRAKQTAQNDAIPVMIDSDGQLGTQSSSCRFKKEIKPMNNASEAILAFKPVTFHYKSDNKNRPEFGLIAEQVAEVNPDLVVRDKDGEIYTVRYDAINAMLLNEFLKEHRKVEEQQATITELKSTVAQQQKNFESRLAQQEKQIEWLATTLQKVSAQLEMSRPAPQVVENDH